MKYNLPNRWNIRRLSLSYKKKLMEVSGAKDSFDSRDYLYSEFAGSIDVESLPLKTNNRARLSKIQDQSLEKRDWYKCVAFSTSHACDVLWVEISQKYQTGRQLGEVMIEEGILDPKAGAYIVDWPKTAKELSLIDGYTTLKTLEECLHSLANEIPIVIWSNKIKINKKNYAEYADSTGHATCIVDYEITDKQKMLWYFIISNSYWENRFDKWYYYLKFEDFKLLYNGKYSLFINDDRFNKIEKYKTKFKEYKWYWFSTMECFNSIKSLKERKENGKLIDIALRVVYWLHTTI